MARKILLADDSVTAQNMGRKILADAGYEVITVNNGSAALKKIAEQKPELIVLDVYMPGYSGLEVCQRLKEAGDTARIPVLLTVGKLEPFKPEEAKRVRADGYIVKPFEASELLSALSKLEDRIVPRSEPSKPGRFARATAAIEDERYDKTVAADEDSGWRSRIVFPKKKEKAPEADADDAAIYNPVNKDLRTVIDHKVEQHPHAAPVQSGPVQSEEERVNLAALAPEGLPKDVTPEEIAALAAAAAQVKGTLEQTSDEKKAADAKTETKAEAKTEAKEESRIPEPVAGPVEAAPTAPAVTLAEPPQSERTEKETEPAIAASAADVIAAIAGLEHQPTAQDSASSGNGSSSGSRSSSHETEEPVTMAVAASAAAGGSSSRWTAVVATLAPEEASISLEHEMQKAYAAFAAAAHAHSAAPSAVAEPAFTPAPGEVSVSASDSTAAAASIPAAPAPEAASSLAEVASAAENAVTAAITELESVASSYVSQESARAAVATPVATPEPVAQTASGPAPAIEAKSEEPPATETIAAPEASVETRSVEIEQKLEEIEAKSAADAKDAVPVSAEPIASEPVAAAQIPAAIEDKNQEESEEKEEKREAAEPVAEVAAAAAPQEVAGSEIPADAKEAVPETAATNPVSPKSGGTEEMAKKESEVAANTAAAWASWRRIRETGSKSPDAASTREAEDTPSNHDSAAMAVAVGAESSPEDVNASLDSDPEIASIVDSVLADMRPKIVEEIARKLGKKK